MEAFTGKFEMIDPRTISIDHRYQRPMKEPLVATIANGFRWSSFGAVTCYRRNGVVYAVDGQQRLEAAKELRPMPDKVPCIVFPQETIESEARAFLDIQINRKAVNAYEKHRAELIAKVPSAMAIQAAVDKAGFSIAPGGNTKDGRTIFAVRTLHYVYDLLGEEGVVQVLTQVREAWPDEIDGTEAPMLKLIAEVILEQGEKYERQKLTTALGRTTPSQLRRRANGIMADSGGTPRQNLRRALKAVARI